jgi:hypothetical protein
VWPTRLINTSDVFPLQITSRQRRLLVSRTVLFFFFCHVLADDDGIHVFELPHVDFRIHIGNPASIKVICVSVNTQLALRFVFSNI